MVRGWFDDFGGAILAFGIVVIVVVLVGILIIAVAPSSPHGDTPCTQYGNGSFECKDWWVTQCEASERYTKDQCVIMVSGIDQ